MRKKTFDCVEMMHEGARQVQAETAGMSRQELLAYWREQTRALRELQKASPQKQRKSA